MLTNMLRVNDSVAFTEEETLNKNKETQGNTIISSLLQYETLSHSIYSSLFLCSEL